MIPTISVTSEETGSGCALLRAVTAGRPRQVRLLLDAGSSVDQADECGQTALIKAVFLENQRTRLRMIQILLRFGAIVSRCDVVGRNALSWACYYGRDKALALLIRHRDLDLDLNMSDVNGCTPLFHAATSGDAACVKSIIDILCKYALSVDVPNFNGITPLMQALRLGHDVCASILIHQGNASTTVRDSNFLSAVDWASRTHGTDIDTTSRKLNFLPVIPTVTMVTPLRPVSNKVNNEEDTARSDSSLVTDYSWYGDSEYDTESSRCSSKSSRDSLEVLFPHTPLTSPRLSDNATKSTPRFNFQPEDSELLPHKSDIQKTKHIPVLYDMLSNQLSDSYRPGFQRSSSRTHLNLPHDKDCILECCTTRSSSPAMSSRSLPSILRVPEERIQRMVAAQRTKSNSTLPTMGKRIGKGPSLRKQLAQKQLQARQTENTDEENRSTSEELPTLPEKGRTSLVSSTTEFIKSTKSKDIEKIISGKGFRL